jgi:iron complex outermembrane receptor protein
MHDHYGYNNVFISGANVGGVTLAAPSDATTKSWAGYGQATFPIASKWKMTLGARYSADSLSASGGINVLTPDGPLPVQPESAAGAKYYKWNWKGVLSYTPTDDILLYLNQSRGSKTAVFNLVTFDPKPVGPESLDASELGVKSTLLNHRLQVNGAIFYYHISDLQVQQENAADNLLQYVNAGRARVLGGEAETIAEVSNRLSVHASVTYVDAKYTQFDGAEYFYPNPNPPYGYLPGVAGSAKGNYLSYASRISGSVGFRYHVPVATGEWSLSANYAYTGKYYWSDDNLIYQPGYGLLDARLSFAFAGTGVTLSAWGSNLTDKLYYVNAAQVTPIGAVGVPAAPRRYGVTLNYKFK